MSECVHRREFLASVVAAAAGASLSGCGTLMHPERRGQPAGRLDWGIVALDAVGLLFFFVPGVVAFAVDFSNGTIYMPPDYYYSSDRPRPELQRVVLPPNQLSQAHVEQVVSQHAGRRVRLDGEAYETRPMQNVGEFWGTYDAVAGGTER